jgi:hypothetical protein
MKFDRTKMSEALRGVLQRMHYPLEVMLVCVRWYAAYSLSFRNIEEMMAERGVFLDHSTLHRWSIKMLPVLTAKNIQIHASAREGGLVPEALDDLRMEFAVVGYGTLRGAGTAPTRRLSLERSTALA